ncbi:MAG: response regulator [Lentisphaeraceae bacterium]|nr:response regulator [Lentisphaeraceae bacterium]
MLKKIVVIDDELSFCNLLEELIQELGAYETRKFTSGAEALAIIGSFKPDAVFVDMLMPDKDGGAVIQSIKELLNPLPTIVMVTGMVAEDEVSTSSFPILAKPLNVDSLKKILEQL